MKMPERLNRDQRAENMRRIKGKHTKPELLVRSTIHKMGYRYRLHCSDLPGKPDLVFPRRKKVIFVNGCFWHGHNCARGMQRPKTNIEFWMKKIEDNRKRDTLNLALLGAAGWIPLIVWECALVGKFRCPASVLEQYLSRWLDSGDSTTVVQGLLPLHS